MSKNKKVLVENPNKEPGWKALRDSETKFKPKTPGQENYWKSLTEKTITFVDGPAGTGKTLLSCVAGTKYLTENKIKRIILTRPLVTCGKGVGALPGDLNEKTQVYMRHLIDFFDCLLPRAKIVDFVTGGVLEFMPIDYMRGTTMNDAYIIMDEAQNATKQQIRLLLTRIGQNSKMVINGDSEQSDIYNSGFGDALERMGYPSHPDIGVVYLNENDIVRHGLVKDIESRYRKPIQPVTFSTLNTSGIPLRKR